MYCTQLSHPTYLHVKTVTTPKKLHPKVFVYTTTTLLPPYALCMCTLTRTRQISDCTVDRSQPPGGYICQLKAGNDVSSPRITEEFSPPADLLPYTTEIRIGFGTVHSLASHLLYNHLSQLPPFACTQPPPMSSCF